MDNFSCHYGNYRRLEAQKKWDVTLRKRREIRGIKPEKRLLNMTTGYGIKSPQELAEAVRRMKPLDLAPFCATPEKTKEDKAS